MKTAALAAVLLVLVAAPAGQATSAPSSEVRALAREAAHDPAALARLRQIDVVDGQPVRIGQVLAVTGPTLDARLRSLAAQGKHVTPSIDSRGEARRILNGRKYRGSPVPRPLHGFLHSAGRELSRFFHWLGRELARPFHWIGLPSPHVGVAGGTASILGDILVVLAVVIIAVVVTRLARRRGGLRLEVGGRRTPRGGRLDDDPIRLEESADEAERAGDLAGAVRLRFRAGLLQLARAKVIPARSSVATREVRAAVRSSDFDELAQTFDEVVYGRRAAEPVDVERARVGWRRLLEGARRP